jgi:hypothetical protein
LSYDTKLLAEFVKRYGREPTDEADYDLGVQSIRAAALAQTLPPARRKRQERPLILEADIPDVIPAPDGAAFTREVYRIAKTRKKGDPSYPLIVTVLLRTLYCMATNRRETQQQIAAACLCSDESVRRVLLFTKPHQLLNWFNVMGRVGGKLWRRANLYLSPHLISASAMRLPRRIVEKSAAFLVHAGELLGLAVRPRGLNTTPLRQPGYV